jgi:hypothetical protein
MHMPTRTVAIVLALAAVACGEPAQDRGDGESAGVDDTGDETSGGTTPAPTTGDTPSPTTTASTTATATTDPSDTDAETTDGGEDPFVFEDGDPTAYGRIDRLGMPGVATMLVDDVDAYNDGDPQDDAAELYLPEIVARMSALHDALDDDLIAAGLTPCALLDCVQQVRSLILPDVMRVDFTAPAGFPNGRRPVDPALDLTLAVILLDLTEHGVTTLADLPLNPPAGDLTPPEAFPYFAAPH